MTMQLTVIIGWKTMLFVSAMIIIIMALLRRAFSESSEEHEKLREQIAALQTENRALLKAADLPDGNS
jgi:hypothetical protein